MTDPAARPAPPDPSAWRILCFGPSSAGAVAISELVAATIPSGSIDVIDVGTVSSLPDADLFVVDGGGDERRAIEQLRTVRARGGRAPAILVGVMPTAEDRAGLGDLRTADPGAVDATLPNAIAAVAARRIEGTSDPRLERLWDAVHDTRQLLAAGRIARRVKHDINNPLAALLAEAQLLELEPLDAAARDAVSRIVALAHRVIDEARALEGPKGDGPGGPGM